MQRGAFLLLALVTLVELLALIGGVVVVRRAGREGASRAPAPSLLAATTMSPRVFGWWLIATSLLLLSLSGYLVARFHA